MTAPTEIPFFRWVTLTEQKWVSFRERRRATVSANTSLNGLSGRSPVADTFSSVLPMSVQQRRLPEIFTYISFSPSILRAIRTRREKTKYFSGLTSPALMTPSERSCAATPQP